MTFQLELVTWEEENDYILYIWHLLDLGLTLTENDMPKARDNGKEYNKACGEHNEI